MFGRPASRGSSSTTWCRPCAEQASQRRGEQAARQDHCRRMFGVCGAGAPRRFRTKRTAGFATIVAGSGRRWGNNLQGRCAHHVAGRARILRGAPGARPGGTVHPWKDAGGGTPCSGTAAVSARSTARASRHSGGSTRKEEQARRKQRRRPSELRSKRPGRRCPTRGSPRARRTWRRPRRARGDRHGSTTAGGDRGAAPRRGAGRNRRP